MQIPGVKGEKNVIELLIEQGFHNWSFFKQIKGGIERQFSFCGIQRKELLSPHFFYSKVFRDEIFTLLFLKLPSLT